MDFELILNAAQCKLTEAKFQLDAGRIPSCQAHLAALLDLLIEELVGGPPGTEAAPSETFNPEQVLKEIAIAIKHRTISLTERWKIIYYQTRLTCVPAYADVPEQIVLHEFTERMVHRGLTVIYWNQLKQNVTKLYKELHK